MNDNRLSLWLTGLALVWAIGMLVVSKATIMLTGAVILLVVIRAMLHEARQIRRDAEQRNFDAEIIQAAERARWLAQRNRTVKEILDIAEREGR